ncbi:MAG: ParB/RepB/Spo0J family partition protein [Clostridia bacterium]|nr:ParB/RepB/Spo0J family partition protein [Clostridia bacterium]
MAESKEPTPKKTRRGGLGRGLEALLQDSESLFRPAEEPASGGVTELRIADIEPNRKQARKSFDESKLAELADSIAKHGLIEPVVVRRKENGYYELIAGERRWRASRAAGLTVIPAVIREWTDEQAALVSLVENLQREDLNPVEEANGYKDLAERFSLTQEQIADRVGKSRTQVANMLRILRLPEEILAMVRDGSLSYGHARSLLSLEEQFDQAGLTALAARCAEEDWSVRQLETFARLSKKPAPTKRVHPVTADYYQKLERRISAAVGRKATIRRSADGNSGKLQLAFSSSGDLETLIRTLCGSDFFSED